MAEINNNLNGFIDNFNNVEVKVIDAKKNRSLVAKKFFAKGETIFAERPIVSSQFAWNQFYKYKACEYCLEPLENAEENVRRLTEARITSLPYLKECCATNKQSHTSCPSCSLEYCSETCKETAYHAYHKSMCLGENLNNPNHPYNVLMDFWRQIHLPPETTTIDLILKLIANMKQLTDKSKLSGKLHNFECGLVNEQEQIPHKLLNERYFNELETLRVLTLEYFNNFLYVKECEQWLTPEGFRKLFSLIGRNSQGIGTSPFSVWVENCSKLTSLDKAEKKKLDKFIDKVYATLDKVSESFLNAEGSGLYEFQSMCNHSCKPNAEISYKYNNFILTLVALEDIKPDQEICISYLDECQLHRSRHSRRKMLKCMAESDQADVTSDEEIDDEEEDEEDEWETEEEEEEEEEVVAMEN